MNRIFCNGFLIQSQLKKIIFGDSSYQGLALRESWPLSNEFDEYSIELSSKLSIFFDGWYEDKKTFELWVCPDVDLICEYINHCNSLNLKIKAYIVSSLRKSPVVDVDKFNNLRIEKKTIGFDYVSTSFDYSSIHDELFVNVPNRLEDFANSLNSNGLFETFDDITSYVNLRNMLIKSGLDLENGSQMCCVKIDELLLLSEGAKGDRLEWR